MRLTTTRLHRFFQELSGEQDWSVMLGGAAEVSALNRWCIIGLGTRQTAILEGSRLEVNGQETSSPLTQAQLFTRFEALRNQARHWPETCVGAEPLPFRGGLFTALGYDFYPWCDTGWSPLKDAQSEWPDAILCEFEDWLFIHLESGQLVVLTDAMEREARYHQEWLQMQAQKSFVPSPTESAPDDYRQSFSASLSPERFDSTVKQLKQNIADGEIYQANLSLQLKKQVRLNPYELFERLCQRNPSPFAGFFKWPGGIIVSNSPERLVQTDGTRTVQTRPIAGTRGRGQTPEEDFRIGQTLLENEKERAEHLMLVDLARNDIGRLCEPGSVAVDDLLVLERYSHVTHLVSNVQGQLQPQAKPWEVLASLFPGGTITGCPKVRCVEILNTAEPVSRGFYTGSFGFIDAQTGALDFNILIRSVFLKPSGTPLVYNAAVHVGAGIVHDAVGANEYRECLRKAAAILNELYTLETQPNEGITHEPEPNPDGCSHF